MFNRWQKDSLREALEKRRVVLLGGPRQCGKTTLCKSLDLQQVDYRTLDDAALLLAAKLDPQGFIKRDSKTLVIDEIQRAPELILAIKKAVDEDKSFGQYLITGSANIQSLPTVQESLASRVRKIRLRPLVQGEISSQAPTFLQQAFEKNFKNKSYPYDRDFILEAALKGGFPEPLSFNAKDKKAWYRDYLEALIERDVKDISKIQRVHSMKELITTLRAWSSKLMDISAIGTYLSVQRLTLEHYINILEMLYLVERLYPWTKTDYERIGKQKKIFMSDSGLMASLLGWTKDQIRFDSDRSGKLIETFIFNELSSQVDLEKDNYELFHYRDRQQREIDFIIERFDGAMIGIEVKSGSSISKSAFKHLQWFKDTMAGKKNFTGIILYTGSHCLSFGKDLWAIPMGTLWEN